MAKLKSIITVDTDYPFCSHLPDTAFEPDQPPFLNALVVEFTSPVPALKKQLWIVDMQQWRAGRWNATRAYEAIEADRRYPEHPVVASMLLEQASELLKVMTK